MATFIMKTRKTLPDEEIEVEADDRDRAIEGVVKGVAAGESIQVLNVVEKPVTAATTGAAGTTGATGPVATLPPPTAQGA